MNTANGLDEIRKCAMDKLEISQDRKSMDLVKQEKCVQQNNDQPKLEEELLKDKLDELISEEKSLSRQRDSKTDIENKLLESKVRELEEKLLNHESQLTAKEEELQRVNMTRQKFEKDNKVLQAMLKHTEVCEQKAPEVPNFQKKVAELLFEVAKLKEELHLARETHASVLKDRNCNKMGAAEAFQEFLSAVPMQGAWREKVIFRKKWLS
ncbi:centromere-associated protein E X3 [Biomphalaria glabrata]|nr:centromere-associated protein E X3 [Biomphalaria glabrata]